VAGRSPVPQESRAAVEDCSRRPTPLRFHAPDCRSSLCPISGIHRSDPFRRRTRVKIIESSRIAAGGSTAKGCEGLNVEHGRQLLIAYSPQEIRAGVCRVPADRQLREQMPATPPLLRAGALAGGCQRALLSTIGKLLAHCNLFRCKPDFRPGETVIQSKRRGAGESVQLLRVLAAAALALRPAGIRAALRSRPFGSGVSPQALQVERRCSADHGR